MSITYEDLKRANEAIQTTDIKGKAYAEVNQRIKAFRMVYPDGEISTEMLSNSDGVCVFKARVLVRIDKEYMQLGVGHAYEKENSTFINKTSYIENAETSAVGRALGMAGFGIDTSVASAEEVQNAMNNQPISKKEQQILKEMVEQKGYTVPEIFKNGLDLTASQYATAVKKLEQMPKKGAQ